MGWTNQTLALKNFNKHNRRMGARGSEAWEVVVELVQRKEG